MTSGEGSRLSWTSSRLTAADFCPRPADVAVHRAKIMAVRIGRASVENRKKGKLMAAKRATIYFFPRCLLPAPCPPGGGDHLFRANRRRRSGPLHRHRQRSGSRIGKRDAVRVGPSVPRLAADGLSSTRRRRYPGDRSRRLSHGLWIGRGTTAVTPRDRSTATCSQCRTGSTQTTLPESWGRVGMRVARRRPRCGARNGRRRSSTSREPTMPK